MSWFNNRGLQFQVLGIIGALCTALLGVAFAASSYDPPILIVGGLVALSVCGSFGGGLYATNRLTRQVRQLTQAAHSIARGNVDVATPPEGHDEVGQLATAFTEMSCYLRSMIGVAHSVAEGDLTVSVASRGAEDALGNSYHQMLENLRALVGAVQEKGDSILTAADQLRESSSQVASASGQTASAIEEVTRATVSLSALSRDSAAEIERVAAGTQQLAAAAASTFESASQSNDEATRIGERIASVASTSESVVAAAQESKLAAERGQAAVAAAISSMDSIATAVGQASGAVDELGTYGERIGDIVKVIDELASQTNLLALNAAIEAARAGEQGRGFAVVAENVRSLAERSADSTREIGNLIAKVRKATDQAVVAMREGVTHVQEGRTIAAEAGTALDSILSSVTGSADEMRAVAAEVVDLTEGARKITRTAEGLATMSEQSAAGANDVAKSTTRVTEAIMQVSATSEETSASAEQVAASSEELAAQSEELSATAGSLRQFALDLNEVASTFHLFSLTDGSSAQHLQAAIEAHRQWNGRLQKAVHTGESDVKPDVAAKDNVCAFGKWLYGDGRTEIGASDVHEKIVKLHATFHQEASRILGLATSGRGAEATKVMAQGSPFAAVQCQLMVELGRAQRASGGALKRAA